MGQHLGPPLHPTTARHSTRPKGTACIRPWETWVSSPVGGHWTKVPNTHYKATITCLPLPTVTTLAGLRMIRVTRDTTVPPHVSQSGNELVIPVTLPHRAVLNWELGVFS